MKKIANLLISLLFIVFSTSVYAIETKYFNQNTRKQVSCAFLKSGDILFKRMLYSTSNLWEPPHQEILHVSFNHQYEHRIILDRIKTCLFVVSISGEILHTSPISSKGIQIEFNDRNVLVLENAKNTDFTRINEISAKKITITPSENVCRIIGADDYRALATISNLPKNNLISVSIIDNKFHIMS